MPAVALALPLASMGPQLYRCGNDNRDDPRFAAYLASMGPQLYRCGNRNREPKQRRGVRMASMGPQLYRCGNKAKDNIRWHTNPCFNGAATLSLRKRQVWRSGCPRYRRFNGAATLSLRKPIQRRSCRTGPCRLQWGRNFIVAETRVCMSLVSSSFSASMGPQLYRCGNKNKGDRGFNRVFASMGPQLYRCGNAPFRSLIQHSHYIASMGPQLYRCGNEKAFVVVPPAYLPASMGPQLYRCGNVRLALNRFEEPPASMGPQLYRCGNFTTSLYALNTPAGFNGAATLSLRKLGCDSTCETDRPLLQWGRNFIVAETSRKS